jgi:hypothetical protein
MSPEKLRQEGSKLYLTDIHCFATVAKISEEVITLNTGSKKDPRYNRYETYEFDDKVRKGHIVAKSQVLFDESGNFVGVKDNHSNLVIDLPPELEQNSVIIQPSPEIISTALSEWVNPSKKLEVGYINEKTGKFSREKKRGYTQIKFTKVKQTITLELDDEKIEELRKLGVL